MEITLKEVTIRDLVDGYRDSGDDGVVGYGGKLDIRPPYQREFIYDDKKQRAVITTINNNFPLNVMYWAKCGEDRYEVIDGQQRTLSICKYVAGDLYYDMSFYDNLPEDKKEKFLDYKLMVYVCDGQPSEKLEWFRVINIAGEKLTDQELRNATFAGTWVTDAKRYFSKRKCVAYNLAADYMKGTPERQDYLETVIDWISHGNIELYMARHQNDTNAAALWMYFNSVITWVEMTFPKKRKQMKGIDWGMLYEAYKDKVLDVVALEEEIKRLILDDDVTNKAGIYYYVLNHDEKHLNIRAFTEAQKIKAHTKQEGVCPICGERFDISFMEADHIKPWSEGGKTSDDNCQMLCRDCNRRKSNK